jgi:uncharacterized protein (DUF1800 family)
MITWDYAAAAHLLRRAGFGATRKEIERAVRRGQARTVEGLLHFRPSRARPKGGDTYKGQRWWLQRMVVTKAPLQEKLVLFWHGHFATSISKVDDGERMHEQNRLFRFLGAGRFRDLLVAVSKDPAMIIWLDGLYNTKDSPNENYGREVMELFTLGLEDEAGDANYTQADVRDAARAFTGFGIGKDGFVFYPEDHDDGVKTVLGLTGNLTGDEVSAHLASRPQCARFLARKLWTFFAYPDPEPAVIDAMAAAYTANDTQIVPVLRTMFLRDEFYAPRAKSDRVSPPAEFVVATLRAAGAKTNGEPLADYVVTMGQDLFNPPNVAGWPGGLTWLTSVRQLARFDFAWRLVRSRLRARDLYAPTKALVAGLPKDATPPDVVDHVLETLGPIEASAATRATLAAYLLQGDDGDPLPFDLRDHDYVDKKVRGLAGLALMLPEAQLV